MEKFPAELKYARTHEWLKIEDGEALVGITAFAVAELSDVVFIELPAPGTRVERNSPFGEIESVKAVFDLSSPVSGEVIAVNEKLCETPQTVTGSPYGEGWMIRVKISDQEEVGNLLSAAEYQELVETEEEH